MSRNLRLLLCGVPDNESELGEVLNHIGTSLDAVIKGLINARNSNQMSLIGPFLGRSILEIGCTAIIARIDPFRVLLLREVQIQPDYQIGEQNKASIQWKGDILSEKVKGDLWKEKNVAKPVRALLGDYYEHIFWRNSIERILAKVPEGRGGEWFNRIKDVGTEGFCDNVRTDLRKLYSSFSKGIHHEFVVSTDMTSDYDTIPDMIRDSFYIIASLGLAVNTISHIPFKISFESAINYYENIQRTRII